MGWQEKAGRCLYSKATASQSCTQKKLISPSSCNIVITSKISVHFCFTFNVENIKQHLQCCISMFSLYRHVALPHSADKFLSPSRGPRSKQFLVVTFWSSVEDYMFAKKRDKFMIVSITPNLRSLCSSVIPKAGRKKRGKGKRQPPFLGLMNQVINSHSKANQKPHSSSEKSPRQRNTNITN